MIRGVGDIADIEAALAAHWSQFGEAHEERGLLWFETAIRHLPYNGVIRAHLGDDADERIAVVTDRMRARAAECLWFVHPTATPADLPARLSAHGLRPVEAITCMSLDLAGWEPPPLPAGVAYEEVGDDDALGEYTELTLRYWRIPPDEQPLVADLQRRLGPGRAPGHRYLARIDGEPVAKGYLSVAGPPGVAALYGMNVVPAARGGGIAAGLTTTLLARARELGCRRVVLHSTPMAVGLYRRAGFGERCPLTVFATAPFKPGSR